MDYVEADIIGTDSLLATQIQSHFDDKRLLFDSILSWICEIEQTLRLQGFPLSNHSKSISNRLQESLQMDYQLLVEALRTDVVIEYVFPKNRNSNKKNDRMLKHRIPKEINILPKDDDGYETETI